MSITLTGFRRMDLIDWVLEGRGGWAGAQSIIGDAPGVCLSGWNIFVNCNLPSSSLAPHCWFCLRIIPQLIFQTASLSPSAKWELWRHLGWLEQCRAMGARQPFITSCTREMLMSRQFVNIKIALDPVLWGQTLLQGCLLDISSVCGVCFLFSISSSHV